MAARTPSIHVFLGRPLFLLSPGIHSIINFGFTIEIYYDARSYRRQIWFSLYGCIEMHGRRNTTFRSYRHHHHHHHHKHPELHHLARSVSRVKVALSIVSLVSQLFSFRVGCKGMFLKGFGFVASFAGVKASSFSIHLSCLVCSLSVVRSECSNSMRDSVLPCNVWRAG
jgi:hypothetical protein